MPSRRCLAAVAAVSAVLCAAPATAMADAQSLATVAVNGAKAVAVQEAQYSVAATKAVQHPALAADVPAALEHKQQNKTQQTKALGNESPSSENGRKAKNKLLDALRKEYAAIGVLDDLITSKASDRAAKQRLAKAQAQMKSARREAIAAGKLLRAILGDS